MFKGFMFLLKLFKICKQNSTKLEIYFSFKYLSLLISLNKLHINCQKIF